jgi:hypothetical protein
MRSATTKYFKMIKDKKELIKNLSYIIMGDAGVYYTSSEKSNCYFVMNMIKDNEDYIIKCKEVLENFTSCKIKEIDKRENRKKQLSLYTPTHPLLTKMRERIYVGNYKSIDNHALKLLDYEALSYLYMSDGSILRDFRPNIGMINPSYRITLNMKRLSYGDQYLLKKALKEKLDLEWNINRNNQYFYLTLRTKDVSKFVNNINPFLTNSFKYKICNDDLLIKDGDIV